MTNIMCEHTDKYDQYNMFISVVEEQSSPAKTSGVESGPGDDESADMEGLEEFNPVGWLAREKIDKPKQETPLK